MTSRWARVRVGALSVALCFAVSCGGSQGASGDSGVLRDAGGGPGDGGAWDAGKKPAMAGPWGPISVAATDGGLGESFGVQISGHGEDGGAVGSVSIQGDVGTLEIAGVSFPVVAYEQIPFSAADETLYQLLGASADELLVAWAYCNAGALNEIWYETTAGVPVSYEPATGTCTASTAAVSAAVELPAVRLNALELVRGFALQGPTLSFNGSDAGLMQLGGQSLWVYPFNTVDCTTCGDGSAGWYELHSVLWNPATSATCFGIYYLFVVSPPAPVGLDYVLCLPTLDDPTNGGTSFQVSYSYPNPDAG